jgi:hypothetical protein
MRRRLAVIGLFVVLTIIVGGSVASGQPPVPGTPQSTFRPPGFGGPAAAAPVGSRPAPYVQGFANSGSPATKPVPPAKGTGVDGCDHTYGTAAQCVPRSFPPGVTDRCGWLAAHGFGPLPVRGPDRLGLDPNHDKVACGPGD